MSMLYDNGRNELTRLGKAFIAGGIALVVSLILVLCSLYKNEIQEFHVVQSVTGNVTIKSDGGYYINAFAKVWEYPKVATVFFSNETDESKDNDGVKVRFANKGEGDISSQVVYRLFNTNEQILKMHEYVAGSQERVEDLILAKLKDIIMEKASNITSSQAVEDREMLAGEIRKEIVGNAELKNIGICVEQFSITQISFDTTTTELFEAQQKADLAKKTAEAEKQNLIMQKERTEAEYARLIAESKGKAEVEKMKQVTDAQRQKELAEIEAQKKVAVEQLAKEEALVKASKMLELAEIEKKTETERLAVIKLQADQKVATAQAKQKEIELSGAITEETRVRLEIDRDTKIGVAKAWATGISTMTLPKTVIVGGGTDKPMSQMETFFNLMNVQKAEQLNGTYH